MSLSPDRKKSVAAVDGSGAAKQQSSIKSYRNHTIVYLPANYPSCPPGLEKLIKVDHIFVRQGMREQDPPYRMINKSKFEVLDGEGRRIFLAKEAKDNILKLCCRGGCGQPFEMSIKDRHSGYEILAVTGYPDCYGAMTASISQNGMSLGFLNEELRCCSSNYIVIDAQGNEIFRIYDVAALGAEADKNKHIKRRLEKLGLQSDKNCYPNRNISTTSMQNIPKDSKEVDWRTRSMNENPLNQQQPKKTDQERSAGTSSNFLTPPDTHKAGTITSKINPIAAENQNLDVSTTESSGSEDTSSEDSETSDEQSDVSSSGTGDVDQGNSATPKNVQKGGGPPFRLPEYYSKSCCIGIGGCLDSCVAFISGGQEFDIYSCEMGVAVGKMSKQWENLYDRYFNLVDCFGVNFPKDLSVRHKALILGALFLIDLNHGGV